MIYYCQLLCTAPKRVSFLHPYMKLVDSSYSSCFTASSVSTSCLHSGHVLCRSSQGTRQSLSNKWPLYPKRLNHLLQNIYTHNKYSITYHGILVTKLPLVRNTSLQIVQVSCLQYLISARCKVTAHRSIYTLLVYLTMVNPWEHLDESLWCGRWPFSVALGFFK